MLLPVTLSMLSVSPFEVKIRAFSSQQSYSHSQLVLSHTPARWPTPQRVGRQRCGVVCAADYYRTLGVGKAATKQDIKSAYRRLARKVPQVNFIVRPCDRRSLIGPDLPWEYRPNCDDVTSWSLDRHLQYMPLW